jgi:large subunit ribosomal protein L25
MKTIVVEGQLREELGKSSTNILRKSGQVPCVVYGTEDNIHFYTTPFSVRDLLYTNEFRKATIKLGEKEMVCIVKDVQFHPVTDVVIHIDFQALKDGQAVKVEMPIRLLGVSEGQKIGGTLVQKMRQVKVKIMPKAMIPFLSVDISAINLGKSIRVRDIKAVEGIEIIANGSIPVASIEIPRALRSAQTKAAEVKK